MTDDDALRRLRSADPAAGHDTDLVALRAAVDARMSASAGQGDSEDGDELVRDELAERRRRRSRRTAWVAGVAASLLVGVAGYGIGTQSADGGGPSADQGAAEPADVPVEQGGPMEPGVMGDGERLAAGGAQDLSWGWGWGGAVFTASGLPDGPGTAEAFGYDTAGVATAENVAALAAAVGLEGEPTDTGYSWSVSDDEGRTLEIQYGGTADLSYYDPTTDPWNCTVADGSVTDGSAGEGDAAEGDAEAIEPAPGCETDPAADTGDPIPPAEEFLAAIGVDTSALELTSVPDGGPLTTVEGRGADEVLGWASWNISVADGVVVGAYGSLAERVSLGAYDVISPTEAVERLMDPRFGSSGGAMPLAEQAAADAGALAGGAAARDTTADQPVESPTSPAPVPQPGSAFAWPVTEHTLTTAELGLSPYWMPDGAVVLLPTWSLGTGDDEQGAWTVVAVTDEALDFDAS